MVPPTDLRMRRRHSGAPLIGLVFFMPFDETLTPTGCINLFGPGGAVIRHSLRRRLTSAP